MNNNNKTMCRKWILRKGMSVWTKQCTGDFTSQSTQCTGATPCDTSCSHCLCTRYIHVVRWCSGFFSALDECIAHDTVHLMSALHTIQCT